MKDPDEIMEVDQLVERLVRLALSPRAADVFDLLDAEPETAPANAVARAKDLAAGDPGRLLRLVVRAAEGVLEVLHASGPLPCPAPVRGPLASGVLVEESLGGLGVSAHLSYIPSAGFAILLDVRPLRARRGRDEGLRVTLHRGRRELRSDRVRDGRVHFPGLRPGRYRLGLSRGAVALGAIDLDLEA